MERCRRCCPHKGIRRTDGCFRIVCCHCGGRLGWTVPAPRPKALYANDAAREAFRKQPRTGSSR